MFGYLTKPYDADELLYQIQRALTLMSGMQGMAGAGTRGAPGGDMAERKNWNGAERNRIIAALESNDWKRQDTAQHLGISRKVLWEKMRKYQIFDEEPETRESE